MPSRCLLYLSILIVPVAAAQGDPQRSTGGSTEQLQVDLDDTFDQESRSDKVTGDVSWNSGRLTLSSGSSVERALSAGAHVRVWIGSLDGDASRGQSDNVLRIRFRLDGATDCFLRLSLGGDSEGTGASVTLFDCGPDGSSDSAQVVREKRIDWTPGSLAVVYRHGLVLVKSADRVLFAGFVENRNASVRAVLVKAERGRARLDRLRVSFAASEHRSYEPVEQLRLLQANTQNQRMVGLVRQGKYAESVKLGEEVLETRKAILGENHSEYAASLNNTAFAHQQAGNFARAESLHKEALRLRKRILGEWHPHYTQSLNNLAVVTHHRGDYTAARSQLRRVLEAYGFVLGRRSADYGRTLNNLAGVTYALGDYPGAVALFREAREIERVTVGEQSPRYAATLSNLAMSCAAIGQYAESEKLHRESARILEGAVGKRHVSYAISLNNLAGLYDRTGDYAQALQLYEQALEIREASLAKDHPDRAIMLNNIAMVCQNVGRYERARELYEEALRIRRVAFGKQHPACATVLNNMAMLCHLTGDDKESQRCFEQAIAIREIALGRLHPDYAASLNNLAVLFVSLGQFDRAQELFDQSLAVKKSALGTQHLDYALTLNAMAMLCSWRGDERAIHLAAEAEQIARLSIDRLAVVQSERQQRRSQIVSRFYIDRRLSLGLQSTEDVPQLLESVWRWKGSVSLRQRAYRSLATTPELAPYFENLQAVTRNLALLRSRAPVPPSSEATESKQTYADVLAAWHAKFAELHGRREKLEQQIAELSSDFRAIRSGLRVTDLQAKLEPSTAFVDFFDYRYHTRIPDRPGQFLSRRHYVAFIVRPDRAPQAVRLGRVDRVGELIQAMRRPFTGETSAASAGRAAMAIREQLWLPVEKHLAGVETVIISPDTVLGTLPFASLPGREAGSYLLEDYRIAMLPLANLMRGFESRTRDNRGKSLLVVGDVNYDGDDLGARGGTPSQRIATTADEYPRLSQQGNAWVSLEGFREEMRDVLEMHDRSFGSDAAVTQLSGTAATKTALLQQAARHDVVHLITHGFFTAPDVGSFDQADVSPEPLSLDNTDPFLNRWMPGLLSGVIMAGANRANEGDATSDDGILRAAEIEAASMNGVDLVVLSACETGLGAVAGGEGLTGLQRAFHIAGAGSVMASLWKVDDRATRELMRRFYENLWVRRQSRIDALRNAQLWMLRNPAELSELGVSGVSVRGRPRDLRSPKSVPARPQARTSPYFWAAFQLSGDWR